MQMGGDSFVVTGRLDDVIRARCFYAKFHVNAASSFTQRRCNGNWRNGFKPATVTWVRF